MELESLGACLQETQLRLEETEQERDEYKGQAEASSAQVSKMAKQIEALQARLASLEYDCRRLEGIASVSRISAESYERLTKRANDKIDQLETQVADLTAEKAHIVANVRREMHAHLKELSDARGKRIFGAIKQDLRKRIDHFGVS